MCNKDGCYISPSTSPPVHQPLDATSNNPFHLFEDRLVFEFADYHFSQQQTSGAEINQALQLWAAQSAKNGFDDVPWRSADEMYKMIDQIRQGNNPWKMVRFYYQGPSTDNLPRWMTEDFVLIMHNIRHLLHEQIACANFHGHWDYVPFMEFNDAGD